MAKKKEFDPLSEIASSKRGLLKFEDIKNHDWEVIAKVETETRRVRDEEDGTFVTKTKARRKIAALDLQLFRTETDPETGAPTRKEYRKIITLPFMTFNNYFIANGFNTTEVARAVWAHGSFGKAFEILPVTADDRVEYETSQQSPEIRAIRERVFSREQYEALQEENDRLLATPVDDGIAVPGGLAYPPVKRPAAL